MQGAPHARFSRACRCLEPDPHCGNIQVWLELRPHGRIVACQYCTCTCRRCAERGHWHCSSIVQSRASNTVGISESSVQRKNPSCLDILFEPARNGRRPPNPGWAQSLKSESESTTTGDVADAPPSRESARNPKRNRILPRDATCEWPVSSSALDGASVSGPAASQVSWLLPAIQANGTLHQRSAPKKGGAA